MENIYLFFIYVGLFLLALYWLYRQCQVNSISAIVSRVNQDSNFIFAESQYSEMKYIELLTSEYRKVKLPTMVWYYVSLLLPLLLLGFHVELRGSVIVVLQAYWIYELITFIRYKFKAGDYQVDYLGRIEDAVSKWELKVINPKLKDYRPYFLNILAFILSNTIFLIWLYVVLFKPHVLVSV